MQLTVPGEVEHLYHIKHNLSQGEGVDRAWLLPEFHLEIVDWWALAVQTVSQPTHLAEIVRHETIHIGFCDASGLGTGGMWLDPSRYGHNLVWHHPCPLDIIT